MRNKGVWAMVIYPSYRSIGVHYFDSAEPLGDGGMFYLEAIAPSENAPLSIETDASRMFSTKAQAEKAAAKLIDALNRYNVWTELA